MTVRNILKMGDPRLLRVAQPVTRFDTDELHLLITDLLDTMHAADGAGLAARHQRHLRVTWIWGVGAAHRADQPNDHATNTCAATVIHA